MKVYLVFIGKYEDRILKEIFDSKDKAEKHIQELNRKNDFLAMEQKEIIEREVK